MAARHSHGTKVKHRVSNQGSVTNLPGVTDVTPPSRTREKILTTPHSSVDETSIAGRVRMNGTVPFTLNWDPANETTHNRIAQGYDAARIDGWEVQVPSGEMWTFAGYVTSLQIETPADGHVTAQIEVMITGAVTYATS